jgi:hypothetical protein
LGVAERNPTPKLQLLGFATLHPTYILGSTGVFMKDPKSTSRSRQADETTVVALKQISVFAYGAISLTLLAGGFFLGQWWGRSPSSQLAVTTPTVANKLAATSCDQNIETLSSSAQPMAAKISLLDCTNSAWKNLRVETFLGRLGATWWVALTPNGNILATVSGNAIEIRDLTTQKTVRSR